MPDHAPHGDASRARSCAGWRHPFSGAVIALALVAAPASAQLAVNRVELLMRPRDPASREEIIGIRNDGASAVQAVVRLEDWDRSPDGSNRWYAYGTRPGPGSCGPALSVFPQSLRLEPGASQSVRVTLDSETAPPGECWAAAVVETVQPGRQGGQNVAYVLRTAVKIYVQPMGLRAEGEIAGLRIVTDSAAATPQRGIEVAFANTGTRHLTAEGMLEVRRPDNAVVTRVPLPDVYALPGARMAVRVPMPALPPGQYVFLATMDYGGVDIAAAMMEHRQP